VPACRELVSWPSRLRAMIAEQDARNGPLSYRPSADS
jgi:hypothetical protein